MKKKILVQQKLSNKIANEMNSKKIKVIFYS